MSLRSAAALTLALLTGLVGCDSAAQEARPVTLVNDTGYLVVYTSMHPSMTRPYAEPPLDFDKSIIKFGNDYVELNGYAYSVVYDDEHIDTSIQCDFMTYNSQGHIIKGWDVKLILYMLSPDGTYYDLRKIYSISSVNSVVYLLIKQGCNIAMSDEDFLERLEALSYP